MVCDISILARYTKGSFLLLSMGISSNLRHWLEVPHRFSYSAENKDLKKLNVPLNGLILSRRRLKGKLKLFPSAFIEFSWRTEQL